MQFFALDAGDFSVCGLVQGTGEIVCWGWSISSASLEPSEGAFVQVSVGYDSTCALDAAGQISCWGDDYWGQSSPPSGTFQRLSVGSQFACALDLDGGVECWGKDTSGQVSQAPK